MTKPTSAESSAATRSKQRKHSKEKKKEKGEKYGSVNERKPSSKRKRAEETKEQGDFCSERHQDEKPNKRSSVAREDHNHSGNVLATSSGGSVPRKVLNFPHRYILAPMVGASELAFRMLCRRYGVQLAYTPMMSAQKFSTDKSYREEEFQTCAEDRPLVCHFCANDPRDFAAAAVAAEPYCDAIDLNLGCPQRTAYVGHFGSYLLDPKDRELVCSIVRAGAQAVQIPIVCKIRLLDTLEDTIQLCKQLRDAGCSLIAVHARYRASWERKGPGARDGPALLDHVSEIKKAITDIPIIANGNTITYEDVVKNLNSTGADGIMSAEGLLDNPALFLPCLGNVDESAIDNPQAQTLPCSSSEDKEESMKQMEKLKKKLRKIARIEKKAAAKGFESLDEQDKSRLKKKDRLEKSLHELDPSWLLGGKQKHEQQQQPKKPDSKSKHNENNNMLRLAEEYLDLATTYHPVKMRTVIFHTRRMVKQLLEKYQLMQECLSADSLDEVRSILQKLETYEKYPQSFVFDSLKAKQEKDALERKRQEEGKRQAYEARMRRKAKREGKSDVEYYLHQGAELPSKEMIAKLKTMMTSVEDQKPEVLQLWKQKYSQHCMSFHLVEEDTTVTANGGGGGGCRRGRACAFLHVDIVGSSKNNTFEEKDEVAG